MTFLQRLSKNLPTLLLAFALSVAVWISAVVANDPAEEKIYPESVPIELIGQDPGIILTSQLPGNVTLTLRAPRSIWDRLLSEQDSVRAVVDLAGLGAGTYNLPVQIQVGVRPMEISSYSPRSIELTFEALASRSMVISLVQRGEVAVGYQAEKPVLSQDSVTISGAASLVNRVQQVRTILDLNGASENIERVLTFQAIDANEALINGVTISPDRVYVSVNINQRGGFRNVVVKVMVSGQVSPGYRVTNISVFPPAVTVFSSDPQLINDLPGYVETSDIALTGSKDDLDLRVSLELPTGVSIVGDQMVNVQVGVAAIEGSLTLTDMPVEVVGLPDGLKASISPDQVDVILSGPLPVLDGLKLDKVQVILDLTDIQPGTYQLTPYVEFTISDLNLESILPGSLEVTITQISGRLNTATLQPTTTLPLPTLTQQP